MPVNTITYQPAVAQLMAAYRPIVFKVEATSTTGDNIPPYVVCDIYLADVYYKSIIRTAPESFTDVLSVFQFDIADALQEYLQPDIAAVDNNNLLQAPHASAKVFCKFRSSDIDEDGFTAEEGTKPVQGTRFTDPVSGTGLQTNTFFAINSALQHEDNMNLAAHLNAYKQGSWSNDAFPLTHRNRYFFCPGDSDHFPFIFRGDCVAADIKLHYRLKGATLFQEATAVDVNVCEQIGYELAVNGNQVTVTMDEVVPADHSAVVQYRKQPDTTWIDAGTIAAGADSKVFYVNGSDIAGDYDIRVIHFCTPCLSADPLVDEFTLEGEEINLAWRGIDPFCELQTVSGTIYIKLDLRNETSQIIEYPDNINPENITSTTFKDLYVQFFSDVARLTPLNVVQNGLKIFAKKRSTVDTFASSVTSQKIIETVETYTINANGVETFLANVTTHEEVAYYSGYPNLYASSTTDNVWDPYPEIHIVEGHTGNVGYATLQEYNTSTNLPTGETKPNIDSDPDYIAPSAGAAVCPVGPDVTTVTYADKLNISKVQMNYDTVYNLYADPVADTELGGYQYTKPLPRNVNVSVSVKAKTLDGTNVTGYVKATVNYIDAGGNAQSSVFNVPNDIETTLPQLFQNINNINISNY